MSINQFTQDTPTYSKSSFEKGQVTQAYTIIQVADMPQAYQDKWCWQVILSKPDSDEKYIATEITTSRKSELREYLFKQAPICCINPGYNNADRPAWIKLDQPMQTAGGVDRDNLYVAKEAYKIAGDMIASGQFKEYFDKKAALETMRDINATHYDLALSIAKGIKDIAKNL